jgi:hypothetical protein
MLIHNENLIENYFSLIQQKNRVKAKKIPKPKPKPKNRITFESVSFVAMMMIGLFIIFYAIVENVWHYFKHHFK